MTFKWPLTPLVESRIRWFGMSPHDVARLWADLESGRVPSVRGSRLIEVARKLQLPVTLAT